MTREIDPKLADSEAAKMLAAALARASNERGLSLRKIGSMLGYKQAVVLSHMTTGRVPIPIDRAEDIAITLEMDPRAFLEAVVMQRHPDVSWSLLTGGMARVPDELTHQLAVSLGRPLTELNEEQRAVLREVAAETRPRRRWLTVHELTAIEVIRKARPDVGSHGLSASDLADLRSVFLTRSQKRSG